MTTYKNILMAFDDSKFSEAALVEAVHWAKAHDAKVTIVHAVFFDSEEFGISAGQLEKRLEMGRAACDRAMQNYCSEFGIDIEYRVIQGEPHEVVPDLARQIEADLIVMGTHGRKGVRRMFMGSVTAGVIIHSPCDVLVVKRKCEECTGEYHRVLVPYDGSRLSKKAVERVVDIADPHKADATILYVIPRYEEMVGFFKTKSIEDKLREEATKVVMEAEKIASENGVSANTVIDDGVAEERIVETARDLSSDLIVLGSHGWHAIDKSIIGSTAERVIAHADVPVLVVRQP